MLASGFSLPGMRSGMASRTAYSKWTPQKPTLFDGHYLRNRSTLDISVLGYIGVVQHKEHSPEVLSIPPGTPCIINHNRWRFIEEFAKLRKKTISFAMSVRPSAWNKSVPTRRIFYDVWYLSILRKSVQKVQVSLKSNKKYRFFTWRPILIFDNISLSSS